MIEFETDVLRGAAFAVKAADRDLRSAIGKETRSRISPRWSSAVRARVRTRQDRAVFTNPRVTGVNPPALVVATAGRRLSGGAVPAQNWPWFEFGSGGPHGRRGQLPRPYRKGRVAYAASVPAISYATRVWVDTIFEVYGRTDLIEVSGG